LLVRSIEGPKRIFASRGSKRIDLAYAEVSSSEKAREHNRDIILELIRSRQPVARADLSRSSGLQPSTISSIVDQLIAERWIIEGQTVKRPRGRRPTMLSLNSNLVTIVADVRPRQAYLAVVDFNGRFLAQMATPITSDPEQSVPRLGLAMRSLMDQHADKNFEGAGVSLPGRVDPDSQRLILAPNLSWSGFDIKKVLQQKLKLQVEMDNDANACLLSELWFGRMDGVRNAVLVSLSEGLGTAILANGQLLSGKSGLAGEFGHIPLDPTGVLCGCGLHGCWETFASSDAALRFYAELAPDAKKVTIHDLLQLTEEGDMLAIQAVSKQASFLGKGLRLITAAISPEVILITGALTTYWNRFGPIVEQELQSTMLADSPPRLEIASGGELARLRGAAAIVLQRHSGYNRSTHLVRTKA
jgi:predicted NBD/HSP70 family sugar kinase